jgi:putative drug exporter of the RND superfamily
MISQSPGYDIAQMADTDRRGRRPVPTSPVTDGTRNSLARRHRPRRPKSPNWPMFRVRIGASVRIHATTGPYRYPSSRRTIAGWVLVVVASFIAAPVLFSSLTSDMGGGDSSESGRADDRIDELFDQLPPQSQATLPGPTVIGVVDGLAVVDPATEAAVRDAAARIAELPDVESVVDAYGSDDAGLRATDGRASVVVVTMERSPDADADEMVDAVRAELERTGAPRVLVGHEDTADDEIEAQAEADLVRAETFALPLALIALIVVFGGLLAAILPLGLAFASMAGALIVLAAATITGDVAVYSINVVTMFGIGVGIDYGLLVVSRFREERARSSDVPAALHRTVATAGRTVAYSGLTVAVALAGLLVFDSSGLRSLAIGGIGVVLVAVFAGLSLLPAVLALVGHRLRPARLRTTPGAFWHIAKWVQRRARPIVAVAGVLLIVAGLPFLNARFENPDSRSLPESSVARQLAEGRQRFPGGEAEPIEVVAMTTPDDPALTAWVATVAGRDDVAAVDVDGTLAPVGAVEIDVTPQGPTQGDVAQAVVADLRQLDAPFETLVGGDAAELVDLKASISDRLPWALAIVGLATIVLLFLMTGSLVVAVKAIAMNVLSLGATFGVLVWVFQEGHLSSLLGFDSVGALDATMPLIVFLFAFGLSMDYEVFLLARIKEAWDETGDNDLAVATGLDRTGRIITSAAALLVIVFAGFAAGELVLIKQLGVGMAVAVIVDATIVRTLLVPATMTLMGRRNWWAPAPLRRFHRRFGLHETPAVTARTV